MSLRTKTIRTAAALPAGDPTRTLLLAALREAQRPENAAQKAIWHAWDTMAATEKVSEFKSFDGALRYLASNVEVDHYDTPFEKGAQKVQSKLKALDRSTRSWRMAYNMWLEGKDISIPRLLADLDKTQKDIKTIWALARNLKPVADDSDFKTAAMAADATMDAFDKAVMLLESGNY